MRKEERYLMKKEEREIFDDKRRGISDDERISRRREIITATSLA